jgi:murein DD-endopeptidase MepM/ murein hydrolase activator NlpD
MPNPAAQIAARLNGQPDLYTALRAAVAELGQPPAITDIIAATDAPTRDRLLSVDAGLLAAVARKATGQDAIPGASALRATLAQTPAHPLFDPDVAASPTMALLTNGEHPDMPAFSDPAFDPWFARHGAAGIRYGLGAYGENRSVYATAQFADRASPERRTMHTGIDVFAPAGTPVFAPLPGRILHLTYNADPLDYGHTLILQHDLGGQTVYTLYGHLAASLPHLHPNLHRGDSVTAGQHIADLGDWPENGGWAAHIHFQIMSSMLAQRGGNFFGVGHASLWDVWSDICLDPNLLMRADPRAFTV